MKIGIAKRNCHITEPQEIGNTENGDERNGVVQIHMYDMEMSGYRIFQIAKPWQIDEPVCLQQKVSVFINQILEACSFHGDSFHSCSSSRTELKD